MTREQLTRENEMLLRQNAELRLRVEALESWPRKDEEVLRQNEELRRRVEVLHQQNAELRRLGNKAVS